MLKIKISLKRRLMNKNPCVWHHTRLQEAVCDCTATSLSLLLLLSPISINLSPNPSRKHREKHPPKKLTQTGKQNCELKNPS